MKRLLEFIYLISLMFLLVACSYVSGDNNKEITTVDEKTFLENSVIDVDIIANDQVISPYNFISPNDNSAFLSDWHKTPYESIDFLQYSKLITKMNDLSDVSPGITINNQDLSLLLEEAIEGYDKVFISLFMYYPYIGEFNFNYTYLDGNLSIEVLFTENHLLQCYSYGMLIFKINSTYDINNFDIIYNKTSSL